VRVDVPVMVYTPVTPSPTPVPTPTPTIVPLPTVTPTPTPVITVPKVPKITPTVTPTPKPLPKKLPKTGPDTEGKVKVTGTFNTVGRIKINRIGVDLNVVEGADAQQLEVGAGHISGTSSLGSQGNCAIAAHRSKTYGKFFNRLNELTGGDVITIESGGHTYRYMVTGKTVVDPDNVSVLRSGSTNELTLVTCTDKSRHRLIIHSVLID
jgi:LPXTG-site transpeptidase (sortase) family protein